MNEAQRKLVAVANELFDHLLNTHKTLVVESVVELFNRYFEWIEGKETTGNVCESWTLIFKRLYENGAAGTMFLHERNTQASAVRDTDGEVAAIAIIFPRWLTNIAFDSNGLVMKHAMDVAIMLDTLAHDPRLNLKYLIPTGDSSIIDKLRPSFEQLDLESASIDLIDWTLSILGSGTVVRSIDDLKIPLFLVQLVVSKTDTKESAVYMFVQLITRLNRPVLSSTNERDPGARYLILNLVTSAESKWPGLFQLVLENIFSRAIAMHIADSEGSVNVEKILGNLAMLFEESAQIEARPGFNAFKMYLSSHWRQVLLLFLNHPSMECRAMGYRVLTNSRFWEQDITSEGSDPHTISKLLMDAWFRHIKGRYLRFGQEEERMVVDEQQRLISYCCQDKRIAKAMLSIALEFILGGSLEIFPTVDINALQQERMSILDKARQGDNNSGNSSSVKRPPQFVTMIDVLSNELDMRDKIYVDNIQRTADLFSQYQALPTTAPEQYHEINFHIFSQLASKWVPETVTLGGYDDVLPKNIPYASDVAIGNAFKDHPILFLIFEKCLPTVKFPSSDMIRSILVYFIVFWNMKEVAKVASTLKFATQLEETMRLLLLLKPMLPELLLNSYHLFPFMSAQDLGDILHQVVWYYIRWHPSSSVIPGIGAKVTESNPKEIELVETCRKRLYAIYSRRFQMLERAPLWQESLKDIATQLGLVEK
ncbi:hypothetical protein K501DRAFT_247853 [Backusella circina FSU 941]|nr:hypothetical protein K501DRAFT_247853 [Backusella circina FSU 941]